MANDITNDIVNVLPCQSWLELLTSGKSVVSDTSRNHVIVVALAL